VSSSTEAVEASPLRMLLSPESDRLDQNVILQLPQSDSCVANGGADSITSSARAKQRRRDGDPDRLRLHLSRDQTESVIRPARRQPWRKMRPLQVGRILNESI
jgi:hypothetical protein